MTRDEVLKKISSLSKGEERAKLLEDEKRYSKDFYNHLCHLDDNI